MYLMMIHRMPRIYIVSLLFSSKVACCKFSINTASKYVPVQKLYGLLQTNGNEHDKIMRQSCHLIQFNVEDSYPVFLVLRAVQVAKEPLPIVTATQKPKVASSDAVLDSNQQLAEHIAASQQVTAARVARFTEEVIKIADAIEVSS